MYKIDIAISDELNETQKSNIILWLFVLLAHCVML